jgi:Tfp pilus assembly protein PilF
MDMAEFFLRRGVFSESEAYLERATRQRSVDPAVYRQAGLAYLLHGDRSMARELLNKALVQNDRDLQTLDALATLEEAEGNRKAAEEHLRAALVVSPANTYVLNRLGNLYLKAGERRQARELFHQVIATKPDDIETWLLLAGMYFEDNDWNNLQILDREVAQRLGNSTRFHAAFGELAMSWGDFDRARISLERTVLLAPGDLRSRNLLARTYVQLDEEDRAIEVLRQAENHLATSAARRERDHRLADLLLMLNRPAEAEKVFDELIRADADDLLAHRGRLQSMVRAGRSDDASREMANLLRVRSGDTSSELVRLQTTVMREQSDYARAQTLLSKAVEQHPNDYDLVLQLALVAADAGDIAEAERRYRSLMALGPGPTNPWFETAANNLGYLFATKGIRLDEAEDLIKDALALNPRAAYILDSLGVVYLKKGDLSKAREYLERAARFAIRDGEIYTNLGQLYEKLGERDMARRMYDKAVLIDPKSQIARDRLDAMADTPSTPTLRQ